MLKIIVDSSADMPEGWPEKYGFEILPIPIQIGDKTYYQGVDLTPELFYELMEDKENKPKTAAPSPTRIKEFIEGACEVGDTVLSIHVSGKLSATFAMVQQAAWELRDKFNMIPFDSEAGSAALAIMAREARLREKAGASIEEILETLRAIREKVLVVLTLNSLDFASRSGRVGAIQAALTSLLRIKLVVTLHEGLLDASDMVRTRQKSLERLVTKVKEQFGSQPIKVAVVHSQDPKTAEKLNEMLKDVMNTVETIFTELSISVAANLGPKTVGIVALPDDI